MTKNGQANRPGHTAGTVVDDPLDGYEQKITAHTERPHAPFDATKELSNTATVLTLAAGQPDPTSLCLHGPTVALNAPRAGTPGRLGANGFIFESSPSPATLRHDGW
jgi:hypothetical protein